MKMILLTLSTFFLLISGSVMPVSAQTNLSQEETLEAEVVATGTKSESGPQGQEYPTQVVRVRITSGSLKGELVEISINGGSFIGAPQYEVGDKVHVLRTEHIDGSDVFYIADYIRRDGLLVLFSVFAIMAIVIGGKWGATSLLGMAFSFLVIFLFVLPQIVAGKNAIVTAIIGTSIIIPVTFSLSHGFKIKTLIAGVSTVITLIITGIIAAISVELTHLTGFGAEEAAFLQVQLGEIVNIKGLLLAGMIIASLGVLDDITISQASVVSELYKTNKKLKVSELFGKGMNVGRDHIASLINTLVLVYTGASLPLFLLFVDSPLPFSEVINYELVAEEIVRTLVGSIGLILAVPITTFLAANYYKKR